MPVVEMAAQHRVEETPVPPWHGALLSCTYLRPASPPLTFSLITAMLSPITCFCTSRKDFRAAAVPRRKALPRCRSTRSAARRVICALFSSPAVPLATASASRDSSADARMLR